MIWPFPQSDERRKARRRETVRLGTSAPIIAKLTGEIEKIVASESYRRKMEKQGGFAEYMDPPTLGKFVSAELAKWGKVVKDAGIKPQN